MPDRDEDLLQHYLRDASQAAFATLVERHLNLVYSAARRIVRAPELAEEVAQSVFADLAQNGRRIPKDTPLVAWLHVVTRRTAIDAVRRDARRRARESAAALDPTFGPPAIAPMKPDASAWTEVEPLLDEAVEALPAPDRAAILLRFFENKSLRDVGAALGTSDDAAQKRVARALDQLRGFLLRRGVVVTAAGLATELSAHAVASAPMALGSTITAGIGALPSTVTASATATVLTMTLLEKTILTAGLIITVGGALFEGNALRAQRRETTAVRQQIDALAAQARTAQASRDLARNDAEAARRRLAAVVGATSSPADAALEATMNAWLDRAAQLRQLVLDRPELAVPELDVLPFNQWLEAAREIKTGTEKEILATLANLRRTAETHFVHSKLMPALRSYLAAHDQAYPKDIAELAPFFSQPGTAAILARYRVATGAATPSSPRPAIEQKSLVDPLRDVSWLITANTIRNDSALSVILNDATQAFMQMNPGVVPKIPDLKPFLPGNVDMDMIESLITPRR